MISFWSYWISWLVTCTVTALGLDWLSDRADSTREKLKDKIDKCIREGQDKIDKCSRRGTHDKIDKWMRLQNVVSFLVFCPLTRPDFRMVFWWLAWSWWSSDLSLDPFDTWSDFGLDSDLDLDVCWDYCKSLLSVIFWWLALICWSSDFQKQGGFHKGEAETRLTSAFKQQGSAAWHVAGLSGYAALSPSLSTRETARQDWQGAWQDWQVNATSECGVVSRFLSLD